MNARDAILANVRAAVGGSTARVGAAGIERRIEARARGPVPARTQLDANGLVDLFELQGLPELPLDPNQKIQINILTSP